MPVIGAENAAVKTPHSPASANAPGLGIVWPRIAQPWPQPEPAAAPMNNVGISAPPAPPEPRVRIVAPIFASASAGARQPSCSPPTRLAIVARPVPATRGVARVSTPTSRPPRLGNVQGGSAVRRSKIFSASWMPSVYARPSAAQIRPSPAYSRRLRVQIH